MKTFILFVGAMFFASGVFSQKVQIGGFYLPQKTGISNSLSDKEDRIYKNKTTFAGGGGVNFTYWFGNVGLQSGLMYISHNQKFISELYVSKSLDSIKTVKGKRRLDYLKVPLLLTYSYLIPYKRNSRISFTTYGGPQFGYLLKGDGAIVVYQHGPESDFYDLPESSSNYYNKFVIDLVLGAGLDFHITRDLSINTSLRFDYSITDVENKDATTYDDLKWPTYYVGDPDRKKSHNHSIGLLLGVSYAFGGDHLLCPSKKW